MGWTELLFIVFAAKLFHMLFLWLAFWVGEKAALDAFITNMYINAPLANSPPAGESSSSKSNKPPSLIVLTVCIFLVDLMVFLIIPVCVYYTFARLIKVPRIGGTRVITVVMVDAAIAWFMAFVVSLAYASIAQNQSYCSYADDGLRGIRAYTSMALCTSLLLILPPYFLLI